MRDVKFFKHIKSEGAAIRSAQRIFYARQGAFLCATGM
jgi:hypothetical protein